MSDNQIILDTSDEAASIKTVTGWVSRNGFFYGDDERTARYNGSTHRECSCGEVIEKNGYCRKCADARSLAKFQAMERKPWDGISMLYSDSIDRYFQDMSEVEDYLHDEDAIIESLRIIICEPNSAREIDPNEHYCDDLYPDGEVPPELADAFDVLNKAIREHGKVLSWSPGKYALDCAAKIEGEKP